MISISDSEIRCIDEYTGLCGTYTVPKFYDVVGRKTSKKLRVEKSRRDRRTLSSTSPDFISLRFVRGLCWVSSRGGSDTMHARHTDDSDIDSRNEEVLCR